jgi:uncharacterized protein (TIGR02599 family)
MRRSPAAFTLIELLTATAILILLLAVVFLTISETGKIWRQSSDKIGAFEEARSAFETMTRTLSQATLNAYYEYFDSAGIPASNPAFNGTPARYGRQSDLHFLIGKSQAPLVAGQVTHAVFFQAPLGDCGKTYDALGSLLNACGYFVRFGDDDSASSLSGRPTFLDTVVPPRWRYRLHMLSQPAEDLSIFSTTGNQWFTDPLAQSPPQARVLAENVIALVVMPKETDSVEASIPPDQRIGAEYAYDSRAAWSGTSQPAMMNQLCPVIRLAMVVIDETSARRLQGASSAEPDLGFDHAGLFSEAAKWNDDLQAVANGLAAKRIGYRIFQTEIPLRSARWTAR